MEHFLVTSVTNCEAQKTRIPCEGGGRFNVLFACLCIIN